MILRFKKVDSTAVAPTKKDPTDAGWDLYTPAEFSIDPGRRRVISLGLVLWWELDELEQAFYTQARLSYYGQFCEKSRPAGESGVAVLGGVIDMRFRGPEDVPGIVLLNTGERTLWYESGAAICQIVPILLPAVTSAVEWIGPIEVTSRGGFGTGTVR